MCKFPIVPTTFRIKYNEKKLLIANADRVNIKLEFTTLSRAEEKSSTLITDLEGFFICITVTRYNLRERRFSTSRLRKLPSLPIRRRWHVIKEKVGKGECFRLGILWCEVSCLVFHCSRGAFSYNADASTFPVSSYPDQCNCVTSRKRIHMRPNSIFPNIFECIAQCYIRGVAEK